MIYKIPKGTVSKLVNIFHNKDADVKDWTTRRDLAFTECLINPATVVRISEEEYIHDEMLEGRKPLAIRLAEEGYALFGGDTGGDRTATYVLAVPFSLVEIK